MINNIVLKNHPTVSTPSNNRTKSNPSVLSRYLAFCDTQKDVITGWYILALLSLGGALMPATMYYTMTYDWSLPFIGVGILLFFSNVLLVISEQHPRAVITTYFATVLFFTVLPLIGIMMS